MRIRKIGFKNNVRLYIISLTPYCLFSLKADVDLNLRASWQGFWPQRTFYVSCHVLQSLCP